MRKETVMANAGTEVTLPLLLNKQQACEVMGGITERKLTEIAGEFSIPIGKSVFFRPEGLKVARDRLEYRRGR